MAQGKKSFLFYADWGDSFDELSNEDAGLLIKHLCDYVRDKDPETDSVLIKALFAQFRNTLKRDLVKWDNRAEQSRINGGKGGRPKNKPKLTQETQRVNLKPKEPVSDSVTVNDNVSDNDILLKKKQKSLSKLVLKDFPYRSKEFLATWKMWLEERKAMRKDYKTERSEKMALAKLIKETENERHAIETIEFAIASGHQGLYPKKERKSPDNRTNKERVADIMGVSRPKSTHNGIANSEGSVTIDADFKIQDD